MFGQLIGQPVQTLVQTRALSGTGGLGVPLRRHTDRQVDSCTGDINTPTPHTSGTNPVGWWVGPQVSLLTSKRSWSILTVLQEEPSANVTPDFSRLTRGQSV